MEVSDVQIITGIEKLYNALSYPNLYIVKETGYDGPSCEVQGCGNDKYEMYIYNITQSNQHRTVMNVKQITELLKAICALL